MTIMIIMIFAMILWIWYLNSVDKNRQKANREILLKNQNKIYEYLKKNNLDECKKYISKDYSCGIVYNEDNDEIVFINKKFTKSDNTFEHDFYNVNTSKLISSEVIIDHQTIINTQRGSQIAGTVVGSVLAGGVGAIIGGLSGSKSQQDNIKTIDMKIQVEDINNPTIKIKFLSPINIETGQTYKNGYKKDSSEVRTAFKHIERWHGIMEVLIRQQNKAVNS